MNNHTSDGAWLDPQRLVGHLLVGRYRLETIVAQGGAGVLYAAIDTRSSTVVAAKVLTVRSQAPSAHMFRFLNEAEVLNALHHPHIVRLLDWGVDEDRLPFLIMEYLTGRSLEQERAERGRLSPEQTFAWLLPIMGAVAYAHDCGVLHRDLKPQNIFIARTQDGGELPKLLDFGIAKLLGGDPLTQSGTIVGTPAFMSPEQALGERLTVTTDVWSMAVVFYSCLADRQPFADKSSTSVLLRIVSGSTPSLRALSPELPPHLCVVLQRAMERHAAERHPNMVELVRDLASAAAADGIALPAAPDPLGLPDWPRWRAATETIMGVNFRNSTESADVGVHVHDACCLGFYRETVISIWRGAPNPMLVREHYHLANRLRAAHGRVSMIIVIEANAEVPGWAELGEIMRFYEEFPLSCVAQVVEGQALLGRAHRTVMTTIHYVRRRLYPIRVFANVAGGVHWLAAHTVGPEQADGYAAGLFAHAQVMRDDYTWKRP